MTFHLLVGERSLLSGGSARVPAAEREAFLDAHALLARAADETAAIAERVEAARAEGRRAGWADAAARVEAEVAGRVAELAERFAAEAASRRMEIAAAALAGAEAILGAFEPDEAGVRLAVAAVARVPDDERVVIACAPALAERIRGALAGCDGVAVEPRDEFGPTRVELLTGAGRVVADLDVQLAALADRWGVAR